MQPVNRNVLRAPRAADASARYARESVTEGIGRTVSCRECNEDLRQRGPREPEASGLQNYIGNREKNARTFVEEGERKNGDGETRSPAIRSNVAIALHAN